MTTTPETLTTWETVTCGRCGGSGSYSYCQMYGSRCFGCGGSGKKYTKRALAAMAWLKEKRQTPVADLRVGQKFVDDGKMYTIVEILTEGAGSCASNGVTRNYISVVGERDKNGERCGFGVFPESTMTVVPSTKEERLAQTAEAIAYQNTLTKTGTPRKK